MGCHREFSVSTRILRNESLSNRRTHGNDFRHLGSRGDRTNSATHLYDHNTDVIFFTELQRNAVSCWNTKTPMNPSNVHIVYQDNTTLIYPVDMMVSFNEMLFDGLKKKSFVV